MSIITTFKNLLIDSLKDHKKLIIGCYIVYIILFILSWILSADSVASAITSFQGTNATASSSALTSLGASELFIQNAGSGILIYIASVFFAIPSIVMFVFNSVNLGVMGQLFSNTVPNGGIHFIIYLIPHGIFEISGMIIQTVAGILLFVFIVKFIRAILNKENDGVSQAFDKTKKLLIQTLVLMIFSTILMLIAAPIEAYFSVPFSEFVMGLF